MIQKPDDSSLTMAAPWDRRISALLHGVAGFYHRAWDHTRWTWSG